MEIRNAKVTAKLIRTYADKIPGGQLRVFCASNTLYWKWRNVRSADRALPFLRQSGILAIRRHCMGLASESQLRIALQYIRHDVPNVIDQVEVWARSGAVSTNEAQTRAVRAVLDAIDARLRRVSTYLYSLTYIISGSYI